MRITRHEEFEMAHILPGYPGGCSNLHGHTYKIEVTIEGPQDSKKWGMVLDFNIFKQIIKRVIPDHCFVYNETIPEGIEKDLVEVLIQYNCKVIGYPFPTTAENMSKYFAEAIEKIIQIDYNLKDIEVVEIKLWETTNSYAHYIKEK